MPDTNDLKETMRKVGALEVSSAAQRQVLKSHGLFHTEMKKEMDRMEATLKEHNDSVLEKIDQTSATVTGMNTEIVKMTGKMDQLMEFRSDMRSATKIAVGKGWQIFVVVITLLALSITIILQLVK